MARTWSLYPGLGAQVTAKKLILVVTPENHDEAAQASTHDVRRAVRIETKATARVWAQKLVFKIPVEDAIMPSEFAREGAPTSVQGQPISCPPAVYSTVVNGSSCTFVPIFDRSDTSMSEDRPQDYTKADWPEVRAIDDAPVDLAALATFIGEILCYARGGTLER